MNIGIRRPNDGNQKDKLCLNIWLDELALSWNRNDRNIYSAHEIAQVVPLVNKENIYQKFLQKNSWILDYWPNSARIENIKYEEKRMTNRTSLIERVAYLIQYKYMESKITREKIGLHRALFHPQDWRKIVMDKFV